MLSPVILLNISKNLQVILLNKVDGYTLATETTRSTNTVNVQFSVGGKIVAERNGYYSVYDSDI